MERLWTRTCGLRTFPINNFLSLDYGDDVANRIQSEYMASILGSSTISLICHSLPSHVYEFEIKK